MSAEQIVTTTYRVARALNELKRARHLVGPETYRGVAENLRHSEQAVALLDSTAGLPREQRARLLATARRRPDEVNEASLCGIDELKWADPGRLVMRPRLAARLGLALRAELKHSMHHLAGTCDSAVFAGERLNPIETGAAGTESRPHPPCRSGSDQK